MLLFIINLEILASTQSPIAFSFFCILISLCLYLSVRPMVLLHVFYSFGDSHAHVDE